MRYVCRTASYRNNTTFSQKTKYRKCHTSAGEQATVVEPLVAKLTVPGVRDTLQRHDASLFNRLAARLLQDVQTYINSVIIGRICIVLQYMKENNVN